MHELSSVLPKLDRHQTTEVKTERIFLIAKPEPLAELIAIKLKRQGYQLEVFHDGISAAIAIHQREPDLIVVDWAVRFVTSPVA